MSNIPAGFYKQTEIGVIPEDWEVKRIDECSKICVGRDLLEANYSPIQDHKYRYPVYSNTVDNKGLYGYYDLEEYKGESLTVVGRGVGLGTAFKRDGGYGAIGRLLVLFPYEKYDASFLAEYINHRVKVFEESSGIPQLTGVSLSKYKIPLPPTKAEQTAIAAALSDADTLITSLEKLITKKRNIKQGVMQELLKPKEGWMVKKLGEVFTITAGGDFDPSQSSSIKDETHCYPIYSNAISDKGLYGYCSYNAHEANSITVTARGTLGVANYRDHTFTAIGRVLVLQPNEPSDCRFFSEYINNRIDFVVESTGVPQLTAPQISKYEVWVPPLSEQTRIAAILSDMDAEIEGLEKKLTKYRRIKQGMMQELLTGRIRLV